MPDRLAGFVRRPSGVRLADLLLMRAMSSPLLSLTLIKALLVVALPQLTPTILVWRVWTTGQVLPLLLLLHLKIWRLVLLLLLLHLVATLLIMGWRVSPPVHLMKKMMMR